LRDGTVPEEVEIAMAQERVDAGRMTPAPAGGDDRRERFAEALCEMLTVLQGRALMLTGNPADARDLVHDTIERALSARHRPPQHEIQPWACRILKNLVIDRWRSRRHTRICPFDENHPSARASDPEEPEPWWRRLGHREVETAIAAAPAHYREVLTLCAIERASYREASQRLGVPGATVASRLHRARRYLRKVLEGSRGD
jgi:RNA polymerase sigma-70 factor, ECF subfamily